MNVNCISIWIPPEDRSIYRSSQAIPYLSCKHCGQSINPGTLVSSSSYDDLIKLGQPNGYSTIYSIRCARCTFEEIFRDQNFKSVINELVREELKKIIKEEVYDPNGTFSPDGPK